MAGIGAEAVTPLNINANAFLQQAVAPSPDIVNPNAVAALTDAFRKGQISADDIIARYGDVAKTKDKAEIQGLSEFISPEAIEARKAAASLMGEKAKEELALLPAHQQATEAKYQAEKLAAQRGDRAAIRAVAIKNGFGGLLSDDNNPDKDFSAYQKAVKYEAAKKGAEDIGKDIERKEYQLKKASGEVVVNPSKDTLKSKTSAINYTQDQAAKAHRLSMMTPEQFIAAGSPTVDEYVFGIEPKDGGDAAKLGVTPVQDLKTPGKTIVTETTAPDGTKTVKTETIQPTEHPNPRAADVVTPATPVASEKPTLNVSGDQVVQEAKPEPENAKMTEDAAQRVQTATAFLEKADEAVKSLEGRPDVVGPAWNEGTWAGRGIAKGGAFFGNKAARATAEIQNKLDMFLAGSVQATIKSLAGSGNRVMQAEIADEKGLFNRAQPQMTSTPEVWQDWLNDVKKLYQRAAAWEKGNLSPDDAARLDKILSTSKSAASAKPTGRSFTTPSGTTFVEDPKNPGSYILQKSSTAPVAPTVPAPAPVVPGTMRRISDVGGNERI